MLGQVLEQGGNQEAIALMVAKERIMGSVYQTFFFHWYIRIVMEEGTLKSPGFLGEFLGESGVGEM